MGDSGIELSRRVTDVPPYLFAEIDEAREAAEARGVDVVSLGIGDPDQPTPDFVIDAMAEEIREPDNHTYSPYAGTQKFRERMEQYLQDRFGVTADPDDEIIALIGAKEGLGHLPLGLLDRGDLALIPDPSYPVYLSACRYAGASTVSLPLREENGFLPDFSEFSEATLRATKLVFLNYPNNPTGAAADLEFFRQAIDIADHYDFYIVNDAPYAEIYFDEESPPHSILEVEGAEERALELHSFSKTFNMTGWRIAFAAGNEKMVEALGSIKSNMDSGPFKATQHAVVRGLDSPEYDGFLESQRTLMRERSAKVRSALDDLDIDYYVPEGAFYLWAHLPDGFDDSIEFCSRLLDEAGVVFGPGRGYGEYGAGYFRVCLTTPDEDIDLAMERLKKFIRGEQVFQA